MAEGKKATSPSFIYGTAWKKENTVKLVRTAVRAGFTMIDTANQPRHYEESLVGEALEILSTDGISRNSLFVQTKFTPINGHDHRAPYDRTADLSSQVKQSLESSLRNLRTDRVDSYLLHGPYSYPGLVDSDWTVWRAIEDIYKSGKAGMIGVSNVTASQLATFVELAEIKPMVVQNRCFANQGWDRQVRTICQSNGIIYQGFSLLTANPYLLEHPRVVSISQKHGVQPEQIIFRFAIETNIVPLTGTTSERHMKDDLNVHHFELSHEDTEFIEKIVN